MEEKNIPRADGNVSSLPAEERRETFYDDEDIFYWMDRDDENDLEPLRYLGTFFPHGCRFCM